MTDLSLDVRIRELLPKEIHSYSIIHKWKNNAVVSLKASHENGTPVFVKCFLNEAHGYANAVNYYEKLSHYHKALGGALQLSCPKPIDLNVKKHVGGAIVSEWIAMPRGDAYFKLTMPCEPLRKAGLKQAARWLAAFHTAGMTFNPRPNGSSPARALIADSPAGNQNEHGDHLIKRRLHGDFSPSNIFMNLRNAVGFDFVAEEGPTSLDIAKFVTATAWYGSARVLTTYGKRFERDLGYFADCYSEISPIDDFDALKEVSKQYVEEQKERLIKDAREASPRKRHTKQAHVRLMEKISAHL